MLLNWYVVQKQIEARQAEVARMAETGRLLKEASRQDPSRGRRVGFRGFRKALGSLVVSAAIVIARGTGSEGSPTHGRG